MNVQHIRERLANGFRPFGLQLTNGRRVQVLHPEFVALGRNTIVVVGAEDRVSIIDALHIVSLEDLSASGDPKP